MNASTDSERDPGAQGERTALSWTRTALVVAVNALLVIRTGWADDQPALTVLGAVLLAAAAAAAVYGELRGRALAGRGGHRTPPAAPAIAISSIAVLTVLACLAGVLSVVIEH